MLFRYFWATLYIRCTCILYVISLIILQNKAMYFIGIWEKSFKILGILLIRYM